MPRHQTRYSLIRANSFEWKMAHPEGCTSNASKTATAVRAIARPIGDMSKANCREIKIMAHPSGFEPETSAFGAGSLPYPKCAIEHARAR